ncbi:MAG: flagellin, partial [Candidatus Kapabacteria bacterium]|nr:flagellin [Candidatus Kapabacteria bacterium]MDW7997585.1 flagellin [Bacteroidota bacterium]
GVVELFFRESIMPYAITNGARIRTNTPAENAYNALDAANRAIALRQLRLSSGKRINSAADDVAGYITVRALSSRVMGIRTALNAVGDAGSLSAIAQDALDNIQGLIAQIKEAASQASSGALGTDEKVSLARAAYRLAQQIQSVVDSTTFGGRQLIDGTFSADFVIGYMADNSLITLRIDLGSSNTSDFNIDASTFSVVVTSNTDFAGVTDLNLEDLANIDSSDLGIFSSANIVATLQSLDMALQNVNKVASYLGGIINRLSSQEELLKTQMTNYSAAISRIEDADVAKEQLELIRSQFLQQTSLISLAQANQQPQVFLQLFR